ncbi:hypothetical protein OF376_00935 [Ureaplasma miroungigenitalium]|uniref:Uncharacterized protein n=1 Tax=Ureaplasma miroungigenitalium TaxID=1042321 RepID=A0ABT3BM82_9BACT|nr:hypothetical protein [Ureaplasma miroungigenitalium]MCV3728349.1 hypothetical protein [Ureaplasma miroungigenitalium]MCV3734136.1 hypothetical protein [Ureaplasma miroungigenitalium]
MIKNKSTTTNKKMVANKQSEQLARVLNIPNISQYSEKQIKKQSKNFVINLIIAITTMFITIGIIIVVAIIIGIKKG